MLQEPKTRAEFIALVKRQLGFPVIEINVSDDQLNDAVNLGLSYYSDYHFNGSKRVYFMHKVTDTDRTNKYITIPESIQFVTKLFPVGDALAVQNMFSIQYQIALNDLYSLINLSLVPYYQAMQYVQMVEQLLVGRQNVRFNRHENKCYIDIDWSKLLTGQYIVLECFQKIDPNTNPDVWKDRWLCEYVQALVKKQWGTNMGKFGQIPLPRGGYLSAAEIKKEAKEEIAELRATMHSDFELPPEDQIG